MRRLSVFVRNKIEFFESLLFRRNKKGVPDKHRFFLGELNFYVFLYRQHAHKNLKKITEMQFPVGERTFLLFSYYTDGKSVGRSLNLAGTETLRAYVNVLDRAVNNSLYASDIRFPHFIRASVRVGNFNPETYAFSANITLCHVQNTSIKIYLDYHYNKSIQKNQ